MLRSGASLSNSKSLILALQRLEPTESAVFLVAPGGLVRVGSSCSLELFGLLGAPSTWHGSEVSLFESPLASLSLLRPCEHDSVGLQGLPTKRLGILPP